MTYGWTLDRIALVAVQVLVCIQLLRLIFAHREAQKELRKTAEWLDEFNRRPMP